MKPKLIFLAIFFCFLSCKKEEKLTIKEVETNYKAKSMGKTGVVPVKIEKLDVSWVTLTNNSNIDYSFNLFDNTGANQLSSNYGFSLPKVTTFPGATGIEVYYVLNGVSDVYSYGISGLTPAQVVAILNTEPSIATWYTYNTATRTIFYCQPVLASSISQLTFMGPGSATYYPTITTAIEPYDVSISGSANMSILYNSKNNNIYQMRYLRVEATTVNQYTNAFLLNTVDANGDTTTQTIPVVYNPFQFQKTSPPIMLNKFPLTNLNTIGYTVKANQTVSIYFYYKVFDVVTLNKYINQ